ncbi:MAG: glycosyltransferase [Deltaproteobacteria bacterium]|nr:glycosyltransferase [Deltaproteobacteria bacterium]
MANILVLGAKVPFTRGGQEVLVSTLCAELKKRGHEADTVELPLRMLPKESLLNQAALWRSLDLSEFGGKRVDLVIATKFPTYFAKHDCKVLWLVHQHRAIYDLFGTRYSDFSDDPRDEALRRMLVEADQAMIKECRFISGISRNVVSRLQHYNQIQGETLYPPLPLGGAYCLGESRDYILSVARLCSIKRIDMMIKAMPIVHNFVKLKVVGTADEPGIMAYFNNEIDKHHLWDRIEFLGRVSDAELIDLYANALAVYYAPYNEDYGYVTLEAMASSKPVITAEDSGGVLEFVKHEEHGLVLAPQVDAIGHGVNRLVEDRDLAERLGKAGRRFVEESGMAESGWDQVINRLLSPLKTEKKIKEEIEGGNEKGKKTGKGTEKEEKIKVEIRGEIEEEIEEEIEKGRGEEGKFKGETKGEIEGEIEKGKETGKGTEKEEKIKVEIRGEIEGEIEEEIEKERGEEGKFKGETKGEIEGEIEKGKETGKGTEKEEKIKVEIRGEIEGEIEEEVEKERGEEGKFKGETKGEIEGEIEKGKETEKEEKIKGGIKEEIARGKETEKERTY